MQVETIGFIGFLLVIVLIFLKVPIAFSLLFVGFVGLFAIVGWQPALGTIVNLPFEKAGYYPFTVIPLFILMGELAFKSGFGAGLFNCAGKWVGRLPGGLAVAAVLACAGFAAISGSSIATAATVGKIALPEMERFGYDRKLSAGAVACAGTLGILIPPSIIIVIYGFVMGLPIGKLLLAGFLPGLLSAFMYIVLIIGRVLRKPSLAPRTPPSTFVEKLLSIKLIWPMVVISAWVVVALYSGIATPTEVAALASLGVFVLGIAVRKLNFAKIKDSLWSTAKLTTTVIMIIIGATVFSRFLVLSHVTSVVTDFLLGLNTAPVLVLAGYALVLIFLGMFMDSAGMIILTCPIIIPVLVKMGYDPILLGIVVVILCEIGLITPPLAMNSFVVKGLMKDSTMTEITLAILPYLGMELVTLAILVAFPSITLIIPRLMG